MARKLSVDKVNQSKQNGQNDVQPVWPNIQTAQLSSRSQPGDQSNRRLAMWESSKGSDLNGSSIDDFFGHSEVDPNLEYRINQFIKDALEDRDSHVKSVRSLLQKFEDSNLTVHYVEQRSA